MVSILHRYVFRDLVSSFLLAFFALTIIMVLGGVYRPLRSGLSLGDLLRFLPYALPYSLPWVIPASLLTACLMTYGRLSADNELTATMACGLPLRYMCYPAFVLGLVFTVVALPVNWRLIPYCRAKQKHVLREAFVRRPFALTMLGGRETFRFGPYRVYVESIDADRNILHKVLVIAPKEDPAAGASRQRADAEASPRVQVTRAKAARYRVDTAAHELRITFTKALYTIVTPGQSATRWFEAGAEEHVITIPMEDTSEVVREARAELYTSELRAEAARRRQQATSRSRDERRRAHRRLVDVFTEIHRREALAFASLALCLVGVPLGIWIRRESKLAAFSLAVLVFLLLYALLIGGENLAMEHKLPPRLALWGPDGVMGLLGLGLLWRAFRR